MVWRVGQLFWYSNERQWNNAISTTPEILDKQGIPFYTDIQAGLNSLTTLLARLAFATNDRNVMVHSGVPKETAPAFKHIVAGHSEIYTLMEQAKRVIQYTAQRLESILELVRGTLADGVARPEADLLGVCRLGTEG